MHITDIKIVHPDPGQPRVRLQARVSYDRHARDEYYWLEVPGSIAHRLSLTGSPWLAAMLPVAATFGEPLRIEAPVDPELHKGALQVMRIWRGWDMGLHDADLDLDTVDPGRNGPADPSGNDRLSGAFFSAGVDSFYTVLKILESGNALDELVFIEGYDRHLHETTARHWVAREIEQTAGELGLPIHRVATNLRQTLWGDTSWSFVAHGCAAAFIALALEPRYQQMYMAASVDSVEFDTDMPWGSHPEVDHLLSSRRMNFIHHGAEVGRFTKLRSIAKVPAVQRHLRVCYQSRTGGNCGRCKKCLMAMAMLDVIGETDRFTCFSDDFSYLDRLTRMRFGDPGDIGQLTEIRDAALAGGRIALANAASCAIRHSLRPWNRSRYRIVRRLNLLAPHIRDRLRRVHLKPFAPLEP